MVEEGFIGAPGEGAPLDATLPDNPALAGEGMPLPATHAPADDGGMRLGPYRVLKELGRGGMGTVYLAVRDEPRFTQRVALKVVKRGMDTDEIVRRFVAERQILASLAHPNIARLLDGGSTPDGRPYFVMEYVEGQPITAYAEEQKLSLDARLRLFLSVCGAVQSAHQSLVVHRDLKPANILVNALGEPKLLDFGIAKLLDPSSFGGMSALTGLTPGPMTPDYASPEQRAGGPVTTATDVYGLGLLLYELLVGQSPRSVERQLGPGGPGRLPSQALVALTAKGDERRRLAHRLEGDLDTILGKALEPEPERRYGTAAALAEDVERHLTQRPVAARRPTLAYRLSRTLVRHKLASALALGVCLLAVIAFVQYLAVRRESRKVEAQRQATQSLNDLLLRLMQKARPENNRRETLTVQQILDSVSQELLVRDSRYPPETRAALLESTGDIYRRLGLYPQARTNLERARELREPRRDAGEEAALALAGTLDALGQVSLDQEEYAVARRFFKRALALKERHLLPTALALAVDRNGLGTAFLEEGDFAEAERNFDRACAISRLEGRPKDLADCYNNLGSLAERRGKYARARVLFSLAFSYFRSTLGEADDETLLVKRNLAAVLLKAADPAGAEILLAEIAETRRRLLKPNHPDFVQSLLDLAIARREGRHFVAAQATLDELLEIRRTYRFPRNLDEAVLWSLQGSLALDRQDLETADAAYVKSYEIYRSLPGDQRANLSRVLNDRARVHLLHADPAGALGLARRSLKLAEASDAQAQTGGAVPQVESVLGGCYLALGQPERARPLLERSYQALLRLHGPDHPYTRQAAEYLSRLGLPHG